MPVTSTGTTFTIRPDFSGWATSTSSSTRPIATARATELLDGWAGQVVVSGEIVAERQGFKSHAKATRWANKRIAARVADLFA